VLLLLPVHTTACLRSDWAAIFKDSHVLLLLLLGPSLCLGLPSLPAVVASHYGLKECYVRMVACMLHTSCLEHHDSCLDGQIPTMSRNQGQFGKPLGTWSQGNAVNAAQADPLRPTMRRMLIELQKDYKAMLYGGQVGCLHHELRVVCFSTCNRASRLCQAHCIIPPVLQSQLLCKMPPWAHHARLANLSI
jgi:hypothetical protein